MVVHAHYPARETRVQRQTAALVEAGHEVDVICLRGRTEQREEHDGPVTVRRLPIGEREGGGFVAQLVEYLVFFVLAFGVVTWRHLRLRYDSIQVHNPPDFLVFCALVPKLMGTPVILDLHDLTPEFFAAKAGVDVDHRRVIPVTLQEAASARFADAVITVTETWRQTLVARGVPDTDLTVVMNVPDGRIFDRSLCDERQSSGQGFHVFYHGTFTARYGVDLLLEALASVRQHVPELRATMIGSGEATDVVLELRQRFGLEEILDIVTSPLEVENLVQRICAADVGVVPNRTDPFTDTILPTKLMEYLALDVPVVASRTSAIVDHFDGIVAFFEPGDATDLARVLVDLATDENQRRALAQRARLSAAARDWQGVSDRYLGLLERLWATS